MRVLTHIFICICNDSAEFAMEPEILFKTRNL